jgi:hypothetical protein
MGGYLAEANASTKWNATDSRIDVTDRKNPLARTFRGQLITCSIGMCIRYETGLEEVE